MSDKRRQDLLYPPGPDAGYERNDQGRKRPAELTTSIGRLNARLWPLRADEEALLRELRKLPRSERHNARTALFQIFGGPYLNAGVRASALCERAFGIPPPLPLETWAVGQPGAFGPVHTGQQLLGSWDQSPTPEVRAQRRATVESTLDEEQPALAVLGQGGGEPLPEALLARMNRLLGHDFAHVRIHTDEAAAQAAALLGARALTLGGHIYFGAGEFAPDTMLGERLLLHELTHVVQYDEGRLPIRGSEQPAVSQPDDAVEQEADRIAAAIIGGKTGSDAREPGPRQAVATRTTIARDKHKCSPPSKRRADTSGRDKDPPGEPEYLFDIYIESKIDRHELLLRALEKAFQIKRDQAIQVAPNFQWTDSSPVTQEQVERRSFIVGIRKSLYLEWARKLNTQIVDQRDTGAGGKGHQGGTSGTPGGKGHQSGTPGGKGHQGGTPGGKGHQRDGGLSELSPKEQKRINEETNREFWERTNYKPKQKLDLKNPLDRQQADLWLLLRDALVRMRNQITDTDESLKLFLPEDIQPKDYPQILRIVDKLKQLSQEELDLYGALATHTTKNLDLFEKSLDAFIKFRNQFKQQLEAQAAAEKKDGLQQELDATWQGFDPSQLQGMSPEDRELLARKLAAEQRDKQLKHMVTHPGETVVGMGESLVRVDKLYNGIHKDLSDAANGDASAASRIAAVFGGAGKLSAWVAGVAAVLHVAILFIPGANLASLAVRLGTLAFRAGLTAMVLSSVESEAHIQAAVDAKDAGEFREHVDASGVAEANLVASVALMAAGPAFKMLGRILAPRLQGVSGALRRLRAALLEKSTLANARTQAIETLRSQVKDLPERLVELQKEVGDQVAAIEKLAPQEFVEKLAAGDEQLRQATGITAEQAQSVKLAARKAPAGEAIFTLFHESIVKSMRDALGKVVAEVERTKGAIDQAIADLEAATSPEEIRAALDKAEVALQSVEAPQKGTSSGGVKDPAQTSPNDPTMQGSSGESRFPARQLAEAAAGMDEQATRGLSVLDGMEWSGDKVDALLVAAQAEGNLLEYLRALGHPDGGFNTKLPYFDFYLELTSHPEALQFAVEYGPRLLGKLWRAYRWRQLPEVLAAAEKFTKGASDRTAAIQQLLVADKIRLAKKLGLWEANAPRPKPTKKNLGIDRGSAEWKALHEQVSKRAQNDHPHFTDDQVAAWADMKQTVAAASRSSFDGLQRASKLELLDKFDDYGKDAGVPTSFSNPLRGDLAEWLFNPERGKPKSIFKNGEPFKVKEEGATEPDYGTTETGVQEWVNQKSDAIHRGEKAAVSAARKYRTDAIREAGNLPAGDKYSIDFIRDPGPSATKKMLEILFGPKDGKPSPIYRVKIGERWYTEAP